MRKGAILSVFIDFEEPDMAASKIIGDSTKKSPCFCIHVLFRFSIMVREDSYASDMSVIKAGLMGLQRCDFLGSSKLIT